MKFFIDTANLEMIQEAQDLGILDGVTTNPSLMAKEGISGSKNIVNHYKKICETKAYLLNRGTGLGVTGVGEISDKLEGYNYLKNRMLFND